MNVLMRADASLESGTGHVMRCAALGLRLQEKGSEIHFACAALPDGLLDWLESRGMQVHMIETVAIVDSAYDLAQSSEISRRIGSIDLLVVDHYGLGKDWERAMRIHARRIFAIDDLADRDHDCDVLLDQNLREDASTRYMARIPATARQFIGPRFALLRKEFDDPALLRVRDGVLRQLLVFFGGTDPGNQSLKVIEALKLLGGNAPRTTLVLGLGVAHVQRDLVHAQAAGLECLTVLDSTDRMSVLMAQADLAIGTCGVAAWERCALGLPSIVVVTAENQREDAKIMHQRGALIDLGDADQVSGKIIADCLGRLTDSAGVLRKMGASASEVMHGRGDALREIMDFLHSHTFWQASV